MKCWILSADARTSKPESFAPSASPELRFAEDKLRMLRAVRFAARFGYTIEPATFAAIQKLAAEISQVSRERVRDELTKMLTEGHARQAFLLLDETGLLREVLPEISAMKGVQQPPEFHPEGDVFVHTLLLLQKLPHPCPATLAWGALLHDVGKPPTFRVAPDRIRFDNHVDVGVKMAEAICRRLRFANDDTEQILALVANHMRFSHVPQMKESTFKRFVRMPQFEQHLELHRLDCQASHGDLTSYNFTRKRIASIPPEAIRPASLISGDDLIAAGYVPGPRFKEILSQVEDAQLEGRLQSKDSALEYVRREFPRDGGPFRQELTGRRKAVKAHWARVCSQTVEVKRNIFFLCLSHLPRANCYAENMAREFSSAGESKGNGKILFAPTKNFIR